MKILLSRSVLVSHWSNARWAALVLLLTLMLPLSAVAEPRLHVLLTNDDGYTAPGITAMYEALLAAGYEVSVAAPREQQSGSSMRVTLGPLVVDKIKDNFWAITGTPADSVSFALQKILVEHRPGIVISGINLGQNLGTNTNLSGTVGAAIMATHLGVPAIAISVGLDLAEADAKPVRFPSTMTAFAPAADFLVRLLGQLAKSRDGSDNVLPAGKLLNVNYPALPVAKIKGVQLANVARVGGFVPLYLDTDVPGKYKATLTHGNPRDDTVTDPDTALFADGYITISVLDGELGDASEPGQFFRKRLRTLFDNPIQ